MSAPVLRWQIVTANPDGLLKFYRELFGWSVETGNAMGYRQVNTGPDGIAGGVWPAPEGAPGLVQLFIGVPDVEATVAAAAQLGAKVVVPVAVLPDGDTMAVLTDPFGLTFGLMRHRSARQSE
jgi:predicted enzyme related to lactoylglutathione lyase